MKAFLALALVVAVAVARPDGEDDGLKYFDVSAAIMTS